MKQFYIIFFLVVALCANQVSVAYEASVQQKIDAVNSYQPLQFASQDPNILQHKQELEKYRYQAPSPDMAYIDSMAIDSDYESDSPVAQKKLFARLEEKPFIGGVTPVTNLAEFDDMALEENMLISQKRRPFFSKANWEKWKPILHGEPSYDSLLLGMQAYHTDPHWRDRNNTNNMVALQYGGIAIGTFKNSWYRDTCFAVAARRIWKKQLNKDFSIDVQYKAGIMHGYLNKAPIRLGWIEPIVLPIFGLNYKTSGADFWVIPSQYPVFAVNFRFGIPDPMTYKSVHSKIQTNYEKTHPPKPKQPKIVEPSNEDSYKLIVPEKI